MERAMRRLQLVRARQTRPAQKDFMRVNSVVLVKTVPLGQHAKSALIVGMENVKVVGRTLAMEVARALLVTTGLPVTDVLTATRWTHP